MFCLYTSSKLYRQNLNFHSRWRWWDRIQAIFLNLFYFKRILWNLWGIKPYSPKLRGWKMVSLIAISGLLVQSTLTPSSANSLNFPESSLIQGAPGNQAMHITPFSWAFEASSVLIVSAQRLTESPGRSLSKKVSGVGFRNVIPLSSFRMPVSKRVPMLVCRYY